MVQNVASTKCSDAYCHSVASFKTGAPRTWRRKIYYKTANSARARAGLTRCSGSSDPAQPDSDSRPDEALQDWRSFRAHLVALERVNTELTAELASEPVNQPTWVHELTQPEAGCLLLAKLESMGTFTHAVILLCQHDAMGSSGFIVNMPLPYKMLDVSSELQLADTLQKTQIFHGGPCSRSAANVLHTYSNIQGATCIVEGLYVGGLEDINKLARMGQIQAENLQVLVGCAAWNPGQLRNEMWLGTWHVLAASSNILHECLFGRSNKDQIAHRDQVWHKLLRQAGIEQAS